jgi:hypothetical protein
MNKVIIFFVTSLCLGLFNSCKKENTGKYTYSVKFTSENGPGPFALTNMKHTLFGDYITSLTPSKHIIRVDMLGFQDDTSQCPDATTDILQFIDGNNNQIDSLAIVDFSKNIEVQFVPKLYGKGTGSDWFDDPEITFSYFYFNYKWAWNEIILPEEYRNIELTQIKNSVPNPSGYWKGAPIEDNILRVENQVLLDKYYQSLGCTKYPTAIIFGNTDSTFIYNPKGLSYPYNRNMPFCGTTNMSSIRCKDYTPAKLHRPAPETIQHVTTYVNFNTDGLIQCYAGADNIPYTSDDVFVYAPEFWNQISVRIEAN